MKEASACGALLSARGFIYHLLPKPRNSREGLKEPGPQFLQECERERPSVAHDKSGKNYGHGTMYGQRPAPGLRLDSV